MQFKKQSARDEVTEFSSISKHLNAHKSSLLYSIHHPRVSLYVLTDFTGFFDFSLDDDFARFLSSLFPPGVCQCSLYWSTQNLATPFQTVLGSIKDKARNDRVNRHLQTFVSCHNNGWFAVPGHQYSINEVKKLSYKR